ncbi:Charged multivesicular body protein 2a [Papilio xuthus]|uniref:Charged multivesicular body protein 2a n=1 Tax=Papilio xuthus TaxID=66420 RepID=A0A194PY96_PAPXU|nr:Charged multivesicular body protein 2a [Papilio xuthus]
MEWLFGHRMTPEEMLRKNQRALNKAMRDLDRERLKMEQQEKKVIADIKKLAKDGQMDAVKIMAKDLVRTRRYVRKFMLMKANIQAVALKIQTLKSQSTMAQAMRGVTRAMATMNRQLNMPQIQRILQEFEKQSEIMDMKEEMMNDSIDDAMEADDDEDESDAVVAQIMDELGLQVNDQLSGLPQATGSLSVASESRISLHTDRGCIVCDDHSVYLRVAGKQPSAVAAGAGGAGGAGGAAMTDADAELQARLDNLRRE